MEIERLGFIVCLYAMREIVLQEVYDSFNLCLNQFLNERMLSGF